MSRAVCPRSSMVAFPEKHGTERKKAAIADKTREGIAKRERADQGYGEGSPGGHHARGADYVPRKAPHQGQWVLHPRRTSLELLEAIPPVRLRGEHPCPPPVS